MATKKAKIVRMVEVTQVLTFCATPNEGMTSHQIAFWVHMKPSTHFNKILMGAVDLGWIKYRTIEHRKGVNKREFRSTVKGRSVAAKAHRTRRADLSHV